MQIINSFNLFVLILCVLLVKADRRIIDKLNMIRPDFMVECDEGTVINKEKLQKSAGVGCLRALSAEWCRDKTGCKKGPALIDPKRYTSYESNSGTKLFFKAVIPVKKLTDYSYKVIFDFDPITRSCQAVGALYFHLNNKIEYLCTPLQPMPFKLWASKVPVSKSPSPQSHTANKGKEQSDHPSTSGLSR